MLSPSSVDAASTAATVGFPLSLDDYQGEAPMPLLEILRHRIAVKPLNLVASLLFLAAIVHTFATPKIAAPRAPGCSPS